MKKKEKGKKLEAPYQSTSVIFPGVAMTTKPFRSRPSVLLQHSLSSLYRHRALSHLPFSSSLLCVFHSVFLSLSLSLCFFLALSHFSLTYTAFLVHPFTSSLFLSLSLPRSLSLYDNRPPSLSPIRATPLCKPYHVNSETKAVSQFRRKWNMCENMTGYFFFHVKNGMRDSWNKINK